MTTEAAGSVEGDPLKAVADALDAAAAAAKEGVQDAKAAAENSFPAVSKFVYDLTYKTSYAVSYGVVFGTVFVAKAIPKENAFVHGLVDGARAATDVIHDMKSNGAPTSFTAAAPQGHEPAAQP
jgi:hypothetical protein